MVHKKSKLCMLVLVLIMIFIMQSFRVAAETNSLFYEGKDYSVELSFTNKANISENAALKVTEFYEGSKEYQDYYSQTDEFMQQNTKEQISYARFFDICIMDGETEIEPDDTVQVSISYKKGVEKEEDSSVSVIHFTEDGSKELIEVNEEIDEDETISQILFEGESFSVFGMIIFDGIDSDIKESDSELFTKVSSIDVTKEWSDGYEIHKEDSITVSLYEIVGDVWNKCDEIILNAENDWKGKFENLDRSKEYGIRETKVISGNEKTKATYQSVIQDTSVKSWCKTEENKLRDGDEVAFVFGDETTYLLRRSSDWKAQTLRKTNISISKSSEYGEYCRHSITSYEVWKTIWDEEKKAWLIYSTYGDSYLTLLYDSTSDSYVWECRREKTEGSYIQYENGRISATVNDVTKYMGELINTSGYIGVSEGESAIEEFRIYRYQVRIPGQYVITNTKNETVKEQQIQADVITEKTIDYLGDGEENLDTTVENEKLSEKILNDLYRLNLGLEMQTDATGLDLLLVIDVSSSMMGNNDCKDSDGKFILRAEALRQALNQFIPDILPENTKNRVCVVAFENESIILQDWTQDANEILDKVNFEEDGKMPLYNGAGTNYESALIRAHEAWTKRGYSSNAKAMIFLSDGEPTAYVSGNDNLEAGNVTVDTGTATLGEDGIVGVVPAPMWNVWITDNEEMAIPASNEAVLSFKKHNPEIMIGTIAFNTVITDCLKNLATDSEFVTQVQNGTPNDLIEAMELITKFVPREICVVDELSEYVELYEDQPDFKVVQNNKDGSEIVLLQPNQGLTKAGGNILDKDNPLQVDENQIRLNFHKDYMVENGSRYHLSFNIKASQKAYDVYADTGGKYLHTGDDKTDATGNETSSKREGFYSNGDETKVQYFLNGAKIEKNYRKPVVQADDTKFTIRKTDLDGNVITSGAEFTLYRKAEEEDVDTIFLEGVSEKVTKVAAGVTDSNGKLTFEHLRMRYLILDIRIIWWRRKHLLDIYVMKSQ